jgi:hypothetical protein
MKRRTALERAFELAQSGKFFAVTELDQLLKKGGYGFNALEGMALRKQLRAIIAAPPTRALQPFPTSSPRFPQNARPRDEHKSIPHGRLHVWRGCLAKPAAG